MKIIVSSDFVTPASSELLAEISANILQKEWGTVEVESESVENTKGDLVSTILITIGFNVLSNGVYDLIKLLVNEARQSANARGEEFPKIALEDKDGPKHEESDQEKE